MSNKIVVDKDGEIYVLVDLIKKNGNKGATAIVRSPVAGIKQIPARRLKHFDLDKIKFKRSC